MVFIVSFLFGASCFYFFFGGGVFFVFCGLFWVFFFFDFLFDRFVLFVGFLLRGFAIFF